jgi:hypothetical protein
MAAFEDLARRFRKAWRDAAKQKPWRGYDALLDRGSKDAPTSYPLQRPDQQKFASEATRLRGVRFHLDGQPDLRSWRGLKPGTLAAAKARLAHDAARQ